MKGKHRATRLTRRQERDRAWLESSTRAWRAQSEIGAIMREAATREIERAEEVLRTHRTMARFCSGGCR